ncbi:MAG: vanadium-dependent haloperoxidase [Planctomycetota bacterium]
MRLAAIVTAIGALGVTTAPSAGQHSVARQWNEENLNAIRRDFARPTVHARNLYHVSVAMWDAWAAYSVNAYQVLHAEKRSTVDVEAARKEAISFAAYRVLQARYAKSPGAGESLPAFDALMDQLGYDKTYTATVGNTPAALGNRVAVSVLYLGLQDGANEAGGYENLYYQPINPPLLPDFPGNPDIIDTNRWQPLALEYFIDQSGNPVPEGYPDFLSPEWGLVEPFSLTQDDLTIHQRDGNDWWVYHDPGPPPQIGGVGEDYYKWGFEQVTIWSGHLDPADGVMWDVSPNNIGNATLPGPGDYATYYDLFNGGDWGTGYTQNPATGQPYTPQFVPRGDYARILAEFWADGPESETPPGHWFTLLNYVSDYPGFEKRLGGTGVLLSDLAWDVKAYLAMGGAMHDVAIASWGVKGYYDYLRPISAIRYMADQGQCSDPGDVDTFDINGIHLYPGLIEVVTDASTDPGERHAHLAGEEGKIAVYAWRGHEFVVDPDLDTAGVDWILAENWWPYQRPTFVTPPFAGYVSGHSTYSRAAAELMGLLTGDEYFPGGMGEFYCPANEFLVFEDGPSMDVTLQWAKYNDASDQCSLSRIWGGIHPGADDLPGRIMGQVIGPEAFTHALVFFEGSGYPACPADVDLDNEVGVTDFLAMLTAWGPNPGHPADLDGNGDVSVNDFLILLTAWGACPS